MKAQRFNHRAASVASLCLALACPLSAAPPAPKGSASAPKAQPAEPAEPETPQSVFGDGKDPFFPNSQRINPVIVPVTKTNQQAAVLAVNGIIPGAKPLVMINGRTFEPGETAEVNMGPGRRQRVTCIEIKSDSVIVDVNGERRELRLKTSLK